MLAISESRALMHSSIAKSIAEIHLNITVGHVAVAEEKYNSNRVLTSESRYGSSPFWNAERTNNIGRWSTDVG